jgi:hypothetical protein
MFTDGAGLESGSVARVCWRKYHQADYSTPPTTQIRIGNAKGVVQIGRLRRPVHTHTDGIDGRVKYGPHGRDPCTAWRSTMRRTTSCASSPRRARTPCAPQASARRPSPPAARARASRELHRPHHQMRHSDEGWSEPIPPARGASARGCPEQPLSGPVDDVVQDVIRGVVLNMHPRVAQSSGGFFIGNIRVYM